MLFRSRATGLIINDLGGDVTIRAVDSQTWTSSSTTDLFAHPAMAGDSTLTAGLCDITHDRCVPLRSGLLLAGLTGFAHHALAGIADTLALIGLWLTNAADVSGHLANDFLVNSRDNHLRWNGNFK